MIYCNILQQISRDWSLKTNNHRLLRPWSSSPGAAKAHLPDDGVSRSEWPMYSHIDIVMLLLKVAKRSPSCPKPYDKLLLDAFGNKMGQSVLSSGYLWLAQAESMRTSNERTPNANLQKIQKADLLSQNKTTQDSLVEPVALNCFVTILLYKPIKGWSISIDQTVQRSNNDQT